MVRGIGKKRKVILILFMICLLLTLGAGSILSFWTGGRTSTGAIRLLDIKIGDPAPPELQPRLILLTPSEPTLVVRRGDPIDCVARLEIPTGGTLPSLMVVSVKRAGIIALSGFPEAECKEQAYTFVGATSKRP